MHSDKNKKLVAPVLDRLLHEEDRPVNHLYLRQLRESVRRDLENLMNTRYRCVSPPEEFFHVCRALPNYGLPDLSTFNLKSSREMNRFCSQLADAIKHYEPRIRSVHIESRQSSDPNDPCVRFRMEATLHANPAQELLIFDSTFDPVNQALNIKEID